MQDDSVECFDKRLMFYASRTYGSKLKSGEEFDLLLPLVCICIVNYDFLAEYPYPHITVRNCIELPGEESYFIDTKYFQDIRYEILSLKHSKRKSTGSKGLDLWLEFFNLKSSVQKENFKMKVEGDVIMSKAVQVLDKLGADDEFVQAAILRERDIKTARTNKKMAEKRGHEKGLLEGRLGALQDSLKSNEQLLNLEERTIAELEKHNLKELLLEHIQTKKVLVEEILKAKNEINKILTQLK